MPVVEQAKGIVMAQRGCGPGEAFDVLREMSQRTNVKLDVLAAQMVEQITASKKKDVPPISLDGRGYLRSRTRARPPAGNSD